MEPICAKFDLTKGDAGEIYLRSRYVTEQVAGPTIVTKNGPNAESSWDVGASWAMYANNCYISHQDAYAIVAAGKCIKDANAIVAATIATMQL